jgi:hypothetical protein
MQSSRVSIAATVIGDSGDLKPLMHKERLGMFKVQPTSERRMRASRNIGGSVVVAAIAAVFLLFETAAFAQTRTAPERSQTAAKGGAKSPPTVMEKGKGKRPKPKPDTILAHPSLFREKMDASGDGHVNKPK